MVFFILQVHRVIICICYWVLAYETDFHTTVLACYSIAAYRSHHNDKAIYLTFWCVYLYISIINTLVHKTHYKNQLRYWCRKKLIDPFCCSSLQWTVDYDGAASCCENFSSLDHKQTFPFSGLLRIVGTIYSTNKELFGLCAACDICSLHHDLYPV